MAYCHSCGVYADLNPVTAMCRPCADAWRPSRPNPPDLGMRHP